MDEFAGFIRFQDIRANNGTTHVKSQNISFDHISFDHISFDTICQFTSQSGEVAQVDERTTLKPKTINERVDETAVQVAVG